MVHREALAKHVEAWISKQGRKTERELAPLLGISQASLNEIRNCNGPLGIHVLLALRKALGVPIDTMLGLGVVELAMPPTTELERAIEAAMERRFPKEAPPPAPSSLPPPKKPS